MPNAGAAHVGIQLGVQGPSASPALACSCGTDAMGLGYDLIRRGDADVVICGASEATITPVIVAGDRKSTRLNSSHANISYAVFCLKKQHILPIMPVQHCAGCST